MQDVTSRIQVLGRNPDGTYTVQLDGGNNEQALSLPSQQNMSFPVRINGTVINFASQADFQAAALALSGRGEPQMPEFNTRPMGGGGGGGGGGNAARYLRAAADGADTVNSAMEARNLEARKEEFRDIQRSIADARQRLAGQMGSYASLVQPMLDLFDSFSDAMTVTITNLEEDVTSAWIRTGAGAGRTVSDLMRRGGGQGNGGDGISTLAVGGIALGGGVLLAEALGRGGRHNKR